MASNHGTGTRSMRPKVGLVIGSGGMKGTAVIGLMRVLEREGIEVNMVVGCSAGSVYGAGIALGRDAKTLEEQTMWNGLFSKHNYRAVLRAMLPRFFAFDEEFAIADDRVVNDLMKTLYGDSTFGDARIPLFVVASDLKTGERVVLSDGLIRDAVRASIAIPLLLKPWRVGSRLLIDGGTTDPLPIDVAIREDCETILAMGFIGELAPRISSLMGLIDQTGGIVVRSLLKSTFAFYNLAHDSEIIPLMVSFDRPVGLGDTHLIPYIIEQGEKAAEEQVPYLKELLGMKTA
jgi:NTE family protein